MNQEERTAHLNYQILEGIQLYGFDTNGLFDGSHTLGELYDHRATLFAVICNLFPEKAWKSHLHADGTMFSNDWFIVGIDTPEDMYSYHYHVEHWDKYTVKELQFAPAWDGHTPKDVGRLLSLLAA